MEGAEDAPVQLRCRYCKRNVRAFGCRCDESGRISGRHLRTLREKLFHDGSFNEDFSRVLFIQVLKYIVEIGAPNIPNVNSRSGTSLAAVYEPFARDNKTALLRQIYCDRDRITIFLNLLFPFDTHLMDAWNNDSDNHNIIANEELITAETSPQNIFPLHLTLGYTNEIPVTIRISGRCFYWQDILESVQNGSTVLQWRCTSYEPYRNDPIEYESRNGHMIGGMRMEDYAEDDAHYQRIVNMLADRYESENEARRIPAASSAVDKLITIEMNNISDMYYCCVCQEHITEDDV
ncbi:hypothetical protein KI387_034645, partial [Taxus chinensis]